MVIYSTGGTGNPDPRPPTNKGPPAKLHILLLAELMLSYVRNYKPMT